MREKMWFVCLLWPFLGVTEVFIEVKNPENYTIRFKLQTDKHPTVDGSEIPKNHRLDGATTL